MFGSWQNARANTYRRLHGIPDSWGTAVNVQAMVFGNLGERSATGVAFTRNPSTGAKEIYGEFLVNAQGEDVVAGIRTPQPLTERARREAGDENALARSADAGGVRASWPRCSPALEKRYRDMQDIEFTIQDGKLWMLQTRSGKRTARGRAQDRRRPRRGRRDRRKRRRCCASMPRRSTSCCTPRIDPDAEKDVLATRPAGLARAPRRARSCSTPTRPKR